MRLLERAHLLATLDEELAAALAGSGRLVLVTGEAGIGKTALVSAFRQERSGDIRFLWGQCDPVAAPSPLAPIREIATELSADFEELLSTGADSYLLATRFSSLVSEQPTVLVLEDLHWADGATLDLLVYLGRRLADAPLIVLATFRSDEVTAGHPLQGALGRLAGSPQRRVPVPPLTLAAVTELAAGSEVDAERLLRVTGGNAFYVTEALAAGLENIPGTVVDSVLGRAARLGPAAHAALEFVSVFPSGCELAIVDAESATIGIDECVAAGLLHATSRRVVFRHELARRAIEQSIRPAHARRLHARVLELLEGAPEADPAQLALHAGGAGNGAAVIRYGMLAGRHAAQLGANRAAVEHFAAVVEHVGNSSATMRAEALERLGEAKSSLAEPEAALVAVTEAAQLWEAAQLPLKASNARVRAAEHLWSAGRGPEARELADQVVASLESVGGQPLAHALAEQARLQMLTRDLTGAVRTGQRAIALAEPFGDHASMSRAYNAVGSSLWFLRPAEAEPNLLASRRHAELAQEPELVASALTNLGSGAGEVRLYDTANRWLDEVIEWCEPRDLDAIGDYATAWRARTALEQGEWAKAAQLAGRSMARMPVPITRIVALTVLGLLRSRRGDPGAENALDEAWRLSVQSGDLQRLWPVAAARAESRMWLHGEVGGVDELGEAMRLARTHRHGWAIGELGTWLLRAGEHVDSEAADDSAGPYASWLRGNSAVTIAGWQSLDCAFDELLVHWDDATEPSLRAGLLIAETFGATAVAARFRQGLRMLGVSSIPRGARKATAEHPAGLTARESEVVGLMADGLSNSDIADRLVISTRTVDHHVSSILRKLGVTSRREAVKALPTVGGGTAQDRQPSPM
ncbi:ATP-binding protein [Homoserinimonas sp. A520]